MIDRLQESSIAKSPKSVLLLGPRQVGKSTLIKSLKLDAQVNLANEATFLEYSANPSLLTEIVERKNTKKVFIDEVQRLPSILNTVQALIDDDKSLKFYLTGSSARKLKRGGANLIPGRVVNYTLGPIVARELNYNLDIKQSLMYGFLPEILTLDDEKLKREILLSYGSNYLREEIKAEALTKSIESFSRFLNEICQYAGAFIDYTKMAKRAKISRHTCPNYFEILEDTMLGYRLFPDRALIDEIDLLKHPKFYFFDIGVLNALEKSFDLSSRRLGALMEQLVFQQLFHSASALKKVFSVHTFRTRGGLEIDFLLNLEGQRIAIEVKASDDIQDDDLYALQQIQQYLPRVKRFVFHGGRRIRKVDNIWCLPLADGLKEIGL